MALTPTRLERLRRRAALRPFPEESDPTVFLHVGSVLLGTAIVLLGADRGACLAP